MSPEPERFSVFRDAIALCGRGHLDVVEVGVTLEPSNGASTVFWMSDENVSTLRSIDIDERRLVEAELRFEPSSDKLTLLAGHSLTCLSKLPNYSIDLLYLDGDDDPALTLYEFLAATPKLRPGAIVLVDDLRTKGRLLRKAVAGNPLPFKHEPYGSWTLRAEISNYREIEPLGMMLFRIGRVEGFFYS